MCILTPKKSQSSICRQKGDSARITTYNTTNTEFIEMSNIHNRGQSSVYSYTKKSYLGYFDLPFAGQKHSYACNSVNNFHKVPFQCFFQHAYFTNNSFVENSPHINLQLKYKQTSEMLFLSGQPINLLCEVTFELVN